jgi:putative peptide zinc metalloprotease protein
VARALDPSGRRPRLRPDAEIARFTTRWGERTAIVHSPVASSYLRFTGAEADVVVRMTGRTSIAALVADAQDGAFDPEHVIELVMALEGAGVLVERGADVYAAVRTNVLRADRRIYQRVWPWLRKQTVSLPRANEFVAAVYRGGARLLFTRAANAVALLTLAAGVAAFIALAASGEHTLVPHHGVDAMVLVALVFATSFAHELAHALVIVNAGRRIRAAGFQLYLGNPCFFIDSSDLLLTSRRTRALNAIAGVYAEGVLAGLAGIVVLAGVGTATGDLLYQFTALVYLNIAVNLIPFVELDGYWLLSDLLDIPRLRQRALAVLRYEVPSRIRRHRGRLTRAERALAVFGIGAVGVSAAALVAAWLLWGPIVERLFSGLWSAGVAGRVGLVVLVILIVGPLAHVFADVARALDRRTRAKLDDVRFRASSGWRVEAAEAVAALPLTRGLSEDELSDLAGRVTRKTVSLGEPVCRQGARADAFYVIRRGRFAAVESDGSGGERVLRTLGTGESFGELGLLEQRPRTATVRADTAGELFVIDAATFYRLIGDALTGSRQAAELGPTLEVWALPPFRQLPMAAAHVIAERGEWINVTPHTTVAEQWTSSDAFYVIATGQAEVIRHGSHVRNLGPGDHFGEIGLLEHVPRTATVRTLTPARLFRLNADTFSAVGAATFARRRSPEAWTAYEASGAQS